MPYKISLIGALLITLVGCGSDDPSINKTEQSMSVEQAQQAVINSTDVDLDIADEHYAQYDEQNTDDSNDNDNKIEALPPMSVTDQHDADQGEVILMDDDDADIDDDDADQE